MDTMNTAGAPTSVAGEVKIERLRLSHPLYVVELWEHEQNLERERLEVLKAQTAIQRNVRERARVQGFTPFWRRAAAPVAPGPIAKASALRRLEQFSSPPAATPGYC